MLIFIFRKCYPESMKLNIFKNFKMNWWQTAIFKLSLMSFGVIFGVYFYQFFAEVTDLLWLIVVIGGVYTFYIWGKQ